MPPSLTTIPPEIHGLIGSHLCIRDINSVSRTCKALKDAFLASLYSYVVIRVPVKKTRLVSLENLISSAGDGLKFTTGLCITNQQQPSKEDCRATRKLSALVIRQRGVSASKSRNALIRLLLRRIPDNRLKFFDHRCKWSLRISTLALLIKHQSATLRELCTRQIPEPQNASGLLVEGLQCLAITDPSCEWPSTLMMHNRKTLRRVHLGISSAIARCPIQNRSNHGLLTSFAEKVERALPPSDTETATLSLESLVLYNRDLGRVVDGTLGFQIDIRVLTALRVESCSGLNEAFIILVGNDKSTLSELKLTSFFLRHEGGSLAFAQHLTLLLTAFTGLKHLTLLIDGQRHADAMGKASIFEMHGETLLTLVWDERSGPRQGGKTSKDTAMFARVSKNNNVELISQKCPNLIALGICIPWESHKSDRSSVAYQKDLKKISRRLRKLRTLHLRNLPSIASADIYISMDCMVKGIAYTALDRYTAGKPSKHQTLLITLALGAAVYGDIYESASHVIYNPVQDYLQLRVYHVDLNYQSVLGPSSTVTQVAKGFVDDVTMCCDKDLLCEHWLD